MFKIIVDYFHEQNMFNGIKALIFNICLIYLVNKMSIIKKNFSFFKYKML